MAEEVAEKENLKEVLICIVQDKVTEVDQELLEFMVLVVVEVVAVVLKVGLIQVLMDLVITYQQVLDLDLVHQVCMEHELLQEVVVEEEVEFKLQQKAKVVEQEVWQSVLVVDQLEEAFMLVATQIHGQLKVEVVVEDKVAQQ